MSTLDSQPFPVGDDVIVKLPEGTDIVLAGSRIFKVSGASLYNSSKEFVDKLAKPIYDNSIPDLFVQVVKIEILEPGKQWTTGKFRCRLVFEFVPAQ